jgi:hypothetical protein
VLYEEVYHVRVCFGVGGGVFAQETMTGNKAVRRYRLLYLSLALCALLGGVAIYGLFRNLDILLFRVVQRPAFLGAFHVPADLRRPLVAALVFNLPDGLWLLSGLFLLRALWLGAPRTGAAYRAALCLCALGLELLQAIPTTPGTFDPADLAVMLVCCLLEGMVYTHFFARSFV